MNDADMKQAQALIDAGYDIAQICLNGHLINSEAYFESGRNQNFCVDCGVATIIKCEKCKMLIHGSSTSTELYSYYHVPSFCRYCGEAYPWVATRLRAAKDLAEELEELSENEKALLKQSIDDIVRDTPQTSVAVTRFKRLVIKGGKEVASAFKDILVDVASETAKKMLWP